jgi:hypothetical protein
VVHPLVEDGQQRIEDGRAGLEDFIKKRHADRGQIACGIALETVGLEFGNRQWTEYFFRGGKFGQQVFEILTFQ